MSKARTLQLIRSWIGNNPLGRKLNQRLLIWFAVFSLAPLLATNTIGYMESERIIEGILQRYMHALATVEARHVRDQIERQQMALELIAAGNEFLAAGTERMAGGSGGELGRIASPEMLREYLGRKLAELPAFEMLRLYTPDGRVLITATLEDGRRADIPGSDRAGFFVLRPKTPHESPRFHVVVPLQRDSEVAGFLGGLIGRTRLQAFLEIPEHLAGAVHSTIVDEQGRPIFVSHPATELDYLRPHPISVQDRGPNRPSRYTDRLGTRLMAASAVIPGTAWTFVTEIPESVALGPLRALRRTSAVLEIVFVVLLVIAAWFVAGSIVRPVRNIVAAAKRVAGGDLEARVDVREGDELGELGNTFNAMTAALADASAHVRQLHQQQIERAEQLATVGELASGVAHEIKNPVTGISNGLDLVQRRIGPDPEIAPIMDEMTRQIARIDSAVNDLLAFARPAKPTLSPVDGNQVITRALRLVQPAAVKAGLDVEVHCDADMPAVLLDEDLITQALVNVLVNAVQATGPGGRIIVRTRTTGDAVEYSVSDNGRGITPEDLEHIYKPFFTTRHSGTGLGLSITRETIEHHGGRVHVQSRVGSGTTFTIALPLRPDDQPQLTSNEVAV